MNSDVARTRLSKSASRSSNPIVMLVVARRGRRTRLQLPSRKTSWKWATLESSLATLNSTTARTPGARSGAKRSQSSSGSCFNWCRRRPTFAALQASRWKNHPALVEATPAAIGHRDYKKTKSPLSRHNHVGCFLEVRGEVMARRTYDQYCPAARALDVLGERWTLLMIRELLLGPKRYTDLLEGLPGIAPNVLADRLRHLQTAGIVQRSSLPPPAASMVYELTPLGDELRPVLLSLMTWGLHFLGQPKPGENASPRWLLQLLEAGADLGAARGLRESYQF